MAGHFPDLWESFDAALPRWTYEDPYSEDHAEITPDGKLLVAVRPSSGLRLSFPAGWLTAEGTIQVSIWPLEGDTALTGHYIEFRRQNEDTVLPPDVPDSYAVYVTQEGSARVEKTARSRLSRIDVCLPPGVAYDVDYMHECRATSVQPLRPPTAENILRIAMQENTFQVSVNDVVLVIFRDDDIGFGDVALGAFASDSSSVRVLFDDLVYFHQVFPDDFP